MSWPTTANQIMAGDDVFGSDGDKVGTVAAVLPRYMVVEKGWFFPTDYYIPLGRCQRGHGHVYLNVTKDAALHRGWDTVPVGRWGEDTGDGRPTTAWTLAPWTGLAATKSPTRTSFASRSWRKSSRPRCARWRPARSASKSTSWARSGCSRCRSPRSACASSAASSTGRWPPRSRVPGGGHRGAGDPGRGRAPEACPGRRRSRGRSRRPCSAPSRSAARSAASRSPWTRTPRSSTKTRSTRARSGRVNPPRVPASPFRGCRSQGAPGVTCSHAKRGGAQSPRRAASRRRRVRVSARTRRRFAVRPPALTGLAPGSATDCKVALSSSPPGSGC